MEIKKISILDGFTAVRDDLDWRKFEEIAKVEAYDRTPPELVLERAINADAVLTNKVLLKREHFEKLPKLKYVGILATGYNNVDLAAAREKNIDVTNIPSYGTDSVAQAVFAHILNIANKTEEHSLSVRNGAWSDCKDICFCIGKLSEIAGFTLGLVGYGAIGRAVAKIGAAFNMKVVAYTPRLKIGVSDGFADYVSLDELLRRSDIISLNCPLNAETREIVNSENIAKMKEGAWIINTGRGPLVDEYALAAALKSGKIGAAGIDVLSSEPPPPDNPLLSAPNCHITPHNAWTTFAARKRLIDIAFDNLASWRNGAKKNVVNP